MKKYISNIAIVGILASTMAINAAPRHDKSQYVDYKNEFMNKIDSTIKVFESKPEKKKKKLFADVSQINAPKSIDEFTKVWYNEPISQGNTGTCWSFASTSFLESEAYRLYKKEYKFSEMYTAYCEYIEKAKEFVTDEDNKALFHFFVEQLKTLIKVIRPKKYRINARLGFEDPATMGKVLAYISIFYGMSGVDLSLEPVFGENIKEGSIFLKGNIRIFSVLVIVLRVYRNEQFKKFISR